MTAKKQTYLDRISIDPEILSGKPAIKGTRIPVELVLEQLAKDLDTKTLFEDYPRLIMEDVKACLAYAQAQIAKKKPHVFGQSRPSHANP